MKKNHIPDITRAALPFLPNTSFPQLEQEKFQTMHPRRRLVNNPRACGISSIGPNDKTTGRVLIYVSEEMSAERISSMAFVGRKAFLVGFLLPFVVPQFGSKILWGHVFCWKIERFCIEFLL
jgi:hypothetical protein